jgi:hypothetical protein
MASFDGTRVHGFAWFVFRDPGHDEDQTANAPFSESCRPLHLWWIEGTEDGIRNPIWGDSYLTLSEAAEMPRAACGWVVEPADLDEGFQTGSGEVVFDRLVGVRRTPWGIVQEGDFLVTWPAPAGRPQPGHDALLQALLNGGFGTASGTSTRFRANGEDRPS